MKKRTLIWAGTPLLLYAVCLLILFTASTPKSLQKAETAVVFGNKVLPNGTPSSRLEARLNKALSLYREGYVSKIICSGGIDPQGTNEATAMATFLQRKGVHTESILIDSLGKNTHLTARNATHLIPLTESVILVSERFHTPRCKLAFTHAGFSAVQCASPRFFEPRTLYSWLREVPAYIKYKLKKL